MGIRFRFLFLTRLLLSFYVQNFRCSQEINQALVSEVETLKEVKCLYFYLLNPI